MAPKDKIGPWLFRGEGGGFSELRLTLLPGSGPVRKPVSAIFTGGGKGVVLVQLQVGSE